MENEQIVKKSSSTLGILMTLCFTVICLAVCLLWDRDQERNKTSITICDYHELDNPNITIEQRLMDRRNVIEFTRVQNIYYDLDDIIVNAILTKLGANASIEDIVFDYEIYKDHYISLLIKEEISNKLVTLPVPPILIGPSLGDSLLK